MQTPFLFNSYIDDTKLKTAIEAGQEIMNSFTVDSNDLKKTMNTLRITKHGLNMTYIAVGYEVISSTHIHITSFITFVGSDKKLVKKSDDSFETDDTGKLTPTSLSILQPILEHIVSSEFWEQTVVENLFNDLNKEYSLTLNLDTFRRDVDKKKGVTDNIRKTIRRKYPIPAENECGFHVDPDIWDLLVRNVLRNDASLLLGATGTGKTELVQLVAKTMGLELSTQDCGVIQDAQSALLGTHRLNSEGFSEFDYAPFVGYVQKPGIILLDEISR